MPVGAEVLDLRRTQQDDAPALAVLHEIRAVRELFESIEKRLVDGAIVARPAQAIAPPLSDDTIVDQRTAPVPPGLYLRLARERTFPSKKIGKRIVAYWGDVKAAFLGPGIRKAPTDREPASDGLDVLRRQLGLVERGK